MNPLQKTSTHGLYIFLLIMICVGVGFGIHRSSQTTQAVQTTLFAQIDQVDAWTQQQQIRLDKKKIQATKTGCQRDLSDSILSRIIGNRVKNDYAH